MPSAARLARTSKTVAMFVIASARPLLAARGRGGSDSFNNTKAIGSDCKRKAFTRITSDYVLALWNVRWQNFIFKAIAGWAGLNCP
jgi:hypothetical protein